MLDLEYFYFISNALRFRGKKFLVMNLPRVLSLELGSSRPSSELGCFGLLKEANPHNTHKAEGGKHFEDTGDTDLCAMQPAGQ